MNYKFELGHTLKDMITGFTGVAMARAEYFTGCIHYALCPKKESKGGGIPEWEWIDETRLLLVAARREKPNLRPDAGDKTKTTRKQKRGPGGPMPAGPVA